MALYTVEIRPICRKAQLAMKQAHSVIDETLMWAEIGPGLRERLTQAINAIETANAELRRVG